MRRWWINLHLYVAAFLAPVFVLVAVSGGLYLLGFKGGAESTLVSLPDNATLDVQSASLDADVRQLLVSAGIEHEFEYLKVRDNKVITRPTSREHYVLSTGDGGLQLSHEIPDLQMRMMELHMGHGPGWFKHFQKIAALGLLFVVFSGLWLGLSAKGLKTRTLSTTGAGLGLFLVLVLLA